MIHRAIPAFALAAGIGLSASVGAAQTTNLSGRTRVPLPERAVRRDIPLTHNIRRAFAGGTRDSTGTPGPNYWQLWTDYTIDARLDVAASRIHGRGRIVIHNNSPDSLPVIVLRLHPNIYRGDVPRAGSAVPAENTDGMLITSMAVDGRPVKLSRPTQALGRGLPPPPHPQAASLTSTVARIWLPTPVAPGTSVPLDVDWNFQLPGGPGSGHRMTMRWADTLYQPTQWYPRVAMYDDLRGWDTELYLGSAEFYNAFGRFDVRIDVPAGWIVSGTGLLQNPEAVLTATARDRLAGVLESDSVTVVVGPDELGPGRATAAGDRLIWHFVADTVNDFAWATAKRFVWRVTRATIPGRGPIPIHMLHLPGHAKLFAEAGPITRHALEFYSRLLIPYPFPQLTLQDGPSAGMEYPMVLNANQYAADHETAHQWWPMMVANNETWYGWMDEGFNSYMNIFSTVDAQRDSLTLDGLGQRYGQTSGDEREAPLMWNANYGGPMYAFQAYDKAPMMLSMLGGIVGDAAVQRAMGEFAQAWRFKHPSPWDFAFFMNRALGQDLGWFWYYWLFTTESVDGSIQQVTPRGRRTAVTVRQDGQMPSPVVLKVQFAPKGPPIKRMPNSTLVDSVTAIVTYPVDVWFTGRRTFVAELDFGGRRIEHLTLDPAHRFPDWDATDNVWPKQAPTTRQ